MTTHFVRSTQLVAVSVGLVAVTANPARAQRAEASVEIGYTGSNGITGAQTHLIQGLPYQNLDVTGGFSWGFTAGGFFNENMEVEFLFGRQTSTFQVSNPSPNLKVSDLAVYNYHGNFVYNWGESGARIRPYAFGGLGATHYSPGTLAITPTISGKTSIDSATKFSTTWGGGVKFYPAHALGARAGIRWTPTYIQSNPGGYWCDPWYGCWVLGSAEYSQQFEFSAGVTFRFQD
jgi:opacity protein-like surface antigen